MWMLSRLAALLSLIFIASCSQAVSPQTGNTPAGSLDGTNDEADGGRRAPAGTNDESDWTAAVESGGESDRSALAIFERRIVPIFQSQKPSSCTECHLSGVELKDYIQPDQAKTFASLVEAKL